jgi:hypothetical protein
MTVEVGAMRRALVVVACLVALNGCSVLGYADPKFLFSGKREKQVRASTESFAANLRWGRYEVAAAHIQKDLRIDFVKMVHTPKGLVRFTDYEVLAIELGPGMTEATALVQFKLHRLPSMNEISITDEQIWRYNAWDRRWYLEPSLSTYRDAGKEPLAGLN